MKTWMTIFGLLAFSSTVFASLPHQLICVANGHYQDGQPVSFLLQLSSERTYEKGDPNEDIHEFSFQARICDDDNDAAQCTTYRTGQSIHDMNQPVKLVGFVDSNKVLFEGMITSKSMTGKLVKSESVAGKWSKTMMPFTAKLSCISQSWVELKGENESETF